MEESIEDIEEIEKKIDKIKEKIEKALNDVYECDKKIIDLYNKSSDLEKEIDQIDIQATLDVATRIEDGKPVFKNETARTSAKQDILMSDKNYNDLMQQRKTINQELNLLKADIEFYKRIYEFNMLLLELEK